MNEWFPKAEKGNGKMSFSSYKGNKGRQTPESETMLSSILALESKVVWN